MAAMDIDMPCKLALVATLEEADSFTNVASIPTGHTKSVRAVAWSPSGNTLATASFDANLGIWEREEDGGEWECLTLLEGHETDCSRDKSVWVWEVQPDADFECLGVMMEHSQDVKSVVWHPTEELLASASYDNTIKLYVDDPSDDWYCTSTLSGHTSTVWGLAWSPNGRYLASSSDDKTVKIWQRTGEFTFKEALTLSEHERAVYSVSWGKGKGKSETSTGSDGMLKIWEISEHEGSIQHRMIASTNDAHDVYDVNTVAWCPRDGYEDLLGTAGDDGVVKVWKVALG
ncbi:WD40 repeat-like protein [Hymenopellis radicata]|nr:WD40 repeat-like protein [Hymenopellis radicata]